MFKTSVLLAPFLVCVRACLLVQQQDRKDVCIYNREREREREREDACVRDWVTAFLCCCVYVCVCVLVCLSP